MRKKHKNRKYGIIFLSIILIIGIIVSINLYIKIFSSNVSLENGKQETYLHIPSDANYNDVIKLVKEKDYINDIQSFRWVAKKKNYDSYVQAGRYKIKDGMNNNEIVNILRSGDQEPINLTINNIRTKEELASKISKQIEADSAKLVKLLNDKDFLAQYDFDPQTVYAMILHDSYEFWWNTTASEFLSRMHKEHERFWDEEKRKKAEQLNLSPVEVSTLASIVHEETIRNDEMPEISGVYINRLRKGMPLQADPTLKFALEDFSINRVLNKHMRIDSPYNTYKNRGLPPGPINFPSKKAINSVLNYEDHDYLYFAAKPDFSGYHNFSRTHRQHIRNAQKYRQALNEERIWK
ncbi:MAG: endolytic transglycosylase MltG [Bacteroidota bacterium]